MLGAGRTTFCVTASVVHSFRRYYEQAVPLLQVHTRRDTYYRTRDATRVAPQLKERGSDRSTRLKDNLVGRAVLHVPADGGHGVVEGNGILDLKALGRGHNVAKLAVMKNKTKTKHAVKSVLNQFIDQPWNADRGGSATATRTIDNNAMYCVNIRDSLDVFDVCLAIVAFGRAVLLVALFLVLYAQMVQHKQQRSNQGKRISDPCGQPNQKLEQPHSKAIHGAFYLVRCC